MKKIFLILFILISSLASADIMTEEISYTQGDKEFVGFLAFDDALSGPTPGIIVVHEWWGHNDYARKRARMLAELGYTAFALDMYGDGKQADHPDDAGKFAAEARKSADIMQARFLAAKEVLENHQTVDPKRIAAIGYCFGGSTVLNMARWGVDLDGVVSFHGSLDTPKPAQKGQVKAKVLVCHGADDHFISEEQIQAFKEEMNTAGADYEFIAYEGAKHSFTNPEADEFAEKFKMGIAYNREADHQSWQDMTGFFDKIFQNE